MFNLQLLKIKGLIPKSNMKIEENDMLQKYYSHPHGTDVDKNAKDYILYNHENDTEDIPDGLDPLGGV